MFPKIGILGGGQLGKMLCEAGIPWHLDITVLDRDKNYPAGPNAPKWIEGSFQNYDDVMALGQNVDILTIEIENVNTEALKALQAQGKKVYPQPDIIETIKDKGLQKTFYREHGIPTAPFTIHDDPKALFERIKNGEIGVPCVQKSRIGGYDGKGVSIIKSLDTLSNDFLDVPSIIEELVDISKEVSVIVARNESGDVTTFDPVEMVFDERGNLVDSLLCPAQIENIVVDQLNDLAIEIITKLGMVGILAVEFLISSSGEIFVNEVAPRPHNSGHHTIENCHCSQYEQLLRCLLNFPLIPGKSILPAAMVNILGAESGVGSPIYDGWESIIGISGIHPYLYGKTESRPFRKMGHVTIIDDNLNGLREKINFVKTKLKVRCE